MCARETSTAKTTTLWVVQKGGQVFVAGYQYNGYLRFAPDHRNLLVCHGQLSRTVGCLWRLNYVPGGMLSGQLLPKTGSIPDLVPPDTHALFLNVEFAY